MKKIWYILLLFSFWFSFVYWAESRSWSIITNIPTISSLWENSLTTNIDIKNTSTTILNSWVSTNKNTTPPFCNVNNIWGIKSEYKSNNVTLKENEYIIITYLNTYWKWDFDEINKEREPNLVSKYDIVLASLNKGDQNRQVYETLERKCIEFRNQHPDNQKLILNLYKQVKFFSTYYSNYPKNLTEGVIPWFLIFWIDLVETLTTYLFLLTVLNLIIWTILYMVGPLKKKEDFWKRVILWFWYLLIVSMIKLWILGSIVAFIWYEGLDFLKFFII